ncbi:hypothetical protein CDL15_Pgr020601 [Punica granatum]|uniref:DUF4378 domain-containing protein n=1 Tax=Punica granatum TaxID=22663 RepID=A0A218VVP6_PUNGR|nr:hypothetical protein CDL15_Pgr020601 [Punica granatum]PKI39374.1 hypothetical protein CRG98_040240 [Punica granatum]
MKSLLITFFGNSSAVRKPGNSNQARNSDGSREEYDTAQEENSPVSLCSSPIRFTEFQLRGIDDIDLSLAMTESTIRTFGTWQVREKKTKFVSTNMNSVKARLKAFIAEERSRRKGQHHRSSTSPAHLQSVPADSSHQSKSEEKKSHDQTQLNDGISRRILHQKSGSFSAPPYKPSANYRVEDHSESSNRQNLQQEGLSIDVPVFAAKDFSDTPGLAKINEELLQKILHDKRKFLPQRFHSQKHFSTKIGLQRSGTFHAHDSSGASRASNLQSIEDNAKTNKGPGSEDVQDHEERDGNSNITFTPVHLPQLEDQSENPVATKQFRDMKQKIKHMIRTNQKEKQRIVMDGVLDKIPFDQGLSKEKKEELIQKWRDCVINKDYHKISRSKENYEHRRRHFKRTSSLDNSMDKYSRLFETSFNRESKNHISERLKVGEPEEAGSQVEREKKLLGRILSLPELKSYSFPSEDSSSDAAALEAPNRADLSRTSSRGSSFDSRNSEDLQNQLDEYLEGDQTREKNARNAESAAVVNSRELAEIGPPSIHSEREADIDPTAKSSAGAVGPSPVQKLEVDSQEVTPYSQLQDLQRPELDTLDSSPIEQQDDPSIDEPLEPDLETDLEDTELHEDEPLEDFLRIQVNVKDIELFNYVRDVLELSGLNGPEALEVWHSEDQPLDPSVLEEIEGCPLMDLECSGNEESEDCDHLMLFDMINEVLVDIYQQSVSYWPMPLSRHCHIHRMPVGPHLLKEVWTNIGTYLAYRPELDLTLDHAFSWDLEKHGGWMNLQFESECTGIELEDLIFDDLLEELIL